MSRIVHGDCLEVMRRMRTGSVDLVFCSPPYVDARTYGIKFKLRGQAWVDWAFARYMECMRVSRGLVAWVVEGKTTQFRYDCTPALLMADLHRAGVKFRKPAAFKRVGIPGSGGPDWLRNDWEWIICASHGKLPWSDNTAMGHPPKWAPGGEMSHRLSDGTRRNQWGGSADGKTDSETHARTSNGTRQKRGRPSHRIIERDAYGFTPHVEPSQHQRTNGVKRSAFGNQPSEACGREGYKKTYFNGKGHAGKRLGRGTANGIEGSVKGSTAYRLDPESYDPPVLANPGNVIECLVGGGVMGSRTCHENEAPFPEKLAEFFISSFCPPGGTALDPFCGSGTVPAVAARLGRQWIGIDIRDSQVALTKRRLREVKHGR